MTIKYLGDISLLKLNAGTLWSIEPERIYICKNSPAAEIGLSYHNLPPALTRFVLSCLTMGASQSEMISVVGRDHMRKAKKIIADMAAHNLLHTVSAHALVREIAELRDVDLGESLSRDDTDELRQAFVYQDWLIWSGPLVAIGSAISITRLAATPWAVYDILLPSGNLTLFAKIGARPCPMCLVLWFLGSWNLPISYLNAALQQQSAISSRLPRSARLLMEARANRSCLIAYFPEAGAEATVIGRLTDPHPACGCRLANGLGSYAPDVSHNLGNPHD